VRLFHFVMAVLAIPAMAAIVIAGGRALHRDESVVTVDQIQDVDVEPDAPAISAVPDPQPPLIANAWSEDGTVMAMRHENAPVHVLVPDDAVFHQPNEIRDAAWRGWKQERGLYFLGEKDSRYRDLIEMADPFPNNPGVKRGALVETVYGKGRWVYVGLNLWRQLPAGTDGAYEILANLISLGKGPQPKPAATAAAAQLR